MDFRNQRLAYYAYKLGYVDFQEVKKGLAQEENLENFLRSSGNLSDYELDMLRLLFISHCLLLILKQKDFSLDYCRELLQRQIDDIIANKGSIDVSFLLNNEIKGDRLERIARPFYDNKIMTGRDFNFLRYFLLGSSPDETFFDPYAFTPASEQQEVFDVSAIINNDNLLPREWIRK